MQPLEVHVRRAHVVVGRQRQMRGRRERRWQGIGCEQVRGVRLDIPETAQDRHQRIGSLLNESEPRHGDWPQQPDR